ncbi:MAG: Serine/threonine protein kinase PrkC, regulator of stationary phase [Myxococcaceae bacterium]|nr:Serine/threonine protein kinase PrkC, regulator of stationary phase [Myxococcaceae bacterium]
MVDLPWACPECGAHFPSSFAHCPKDGSKLGARDALVGHELGGRYSLHSRIGAGAMGSVYSAHDRKLQRRVAIKLLSAEVALGSVVLERFEQELKTLSLLRHEHIVEVLDFQHEHGRPYCVMEYLRGEDLAALLKRSGPLQVERVARIVDQCARALGAAHKQGIVHRDLKPANIFLIERDQRSDFVKLLDFGVAKIERSELEPWMQLSGVGETWGTPRYMAPEQAEGTLADARADVYSLGIIMYEGLTGRVPFEGESPLMILQKQVQELPPALSDMAPSLDFAPAVEQVVMRALAKRPEDRFGSMAELNAALREALRSARAEELDAAFRAYSVPHPTIEERRRLAELDPDGFVCLESLRRVLVREHARVLEEIELLRVAEQRALEQQRQAVDEQRRELDEQRRALDAQRRELDEQRRALDERRRELDEQHRQVDEQRGALDERLHASAPRPGEEHERAREPGFDSGPEPQREHAPSPGQPALHDTEPPHDSEPPRDTERPPASESHDSAATHVMAAGAHDEGRGEGG